MRSTVTHYERTSEFLREAIAANEVRLKQHQENLRNISRDIKLTEAVLKENYVRVRFAFDADYGSELKENGATFYSSTFIIWKEDCKGDFRLMFCPNALMLLEGKVSSEYVNICGEHYWLRNEVPLLEASEDFRMTYHYSLDLFIKAIGRYLGTF